MNSLKKSVLRPGAFQTCLHKVEPGIDTGNIVYRKKSGNTAENIIAVRMLARKPLSNFLEYSKVKKLQISLSK